MVLFAPTNAPSETTVARLSICILSLSMPSPKSVASPILLPEALVGATMSEESNL